MSDPAPAVPPPSPAEPARPREGDGGGGAASGAGGAGSAAAASQPSPGAPGQAAPFGGSPASTTPLGASPPAPAAPAAPTSAGPSAGVAAGSSPSGAGSPAPVQLSYLGRTSTREGAGEGAREGAIDRDPAPASSWNPLKTPFAWLVVALHVGLYLTAARMSGGNWNQPNESALVKLGFLELWSGHHEWWRFGASLFLDGLLWNVAISVLILYQAGPALERALKTWRYALIYFAGGLGASLTRELLAIYVTNQVAASAGNGGRSAAFAVLGAAIIGIPFAVGGVKQAISAIVRQAFYYGVLVLLVVLLGKQMQKSMGLGIDIWGVLADMLVGSIVGFAVGLTLRRGTKRTLGFALTTLLVIGVAVEAGWLLRVASRLEGGTLTETPSGSRNNRRVDENNAPPDLRPVASPSPVTSMPDSDPPEIAEKRAKAHALLDPLGPLPGPSPDGQLRAQASQLAQDLADFDNHWTGNASTNLDLEMAQLHLVAREMSSAEDSAGMAKQFLAATHPHKGTASAKRLALSLATIGLVALDRHDDVLARSSFERAVASDPLLAEAHFYLGKLAQKPDKQRAELKTFLDLAGPTPPPSQADLVPEARQLLGN